MIEFLAGIPGQLKVLRDRLTSARALKLDNLDALVSSRLSSCVKSIQTGYIDQRIYPGTPGTEDAYYHDRSLGVAVVVAKSFPIIQVSHAQDNSYYWTARLFSSNVLRISNSTAGAAPYWIRCRYYVIEFN